MIGDSPEPAPAATPVDADGGTLQGARSPRPTLTSPVEPAQRILMIDALRGFALCGVWTINIKGFSGFAYSLDAFSDNAERFGPGVRTVEVVTQLLVEGKFYSIFAFLFGLGFSIQLARSEGRPGWLQIYARRLGILGLFGVAHALLLWHADILWVYALLGFAMMPFRRLTPRRILACGVVLLLAPVPLLAVFSAIAPGYDTDAMIPTEHDFPTFIHLIASSGYRETLRLNFEDLMFSLKWKLFSGRFLVVLGLFLLGLWAGRLRLLQQAEIHLGALRRFFRIAMAIGLAGSVAALLVPTSLPVLAPAAIVHAGIAVVGVHLLGLAYVAGFVLCWQRPGGQRLLAAFGPMGRMALTNYLMQSVVGVSIYYGYGLGWYARMPILITMLIVAPAVLIAQMALSTWWLRRFRYGPMEWIWRQATYGRFLDLRHDPA